MNARIWVFAVAVAIAVIAGIGFLARPSSHSGPAIPKHVKVLGPGAVGTWTGECESLVVRMELDDLACGYLAVLRGAADIPEVFAVRGVFFSELTTVGQGGFCAFLLGPLQDAQDLIRVAGEADEGLIVVRDVIPAVSWWRPGQLLEIRPAKSANGSEVQRRLGRLIASARESDSIGWKDRDIYDTGYLPPEHYLRKRGLIAEEGLTGRGRRLIPADD